MPAEPVFPAAGQPPGPGTVRPAFSGHCPECRRCISAECAKDARALVSEAEDHVRRAIESLDRARESADGYAVAWSFPGADAEIAGTMALLGALVEDDGVVEWGVAPVGPDDTAHDATVLRLRRRVLRSCDLAAHATCRQHESAAQDESL
jgi:hypothetical protein